MNSIEDMYEAASHANHTSHKCSDAVCSKAAGLSRLVACIKPCKLYAVPNSKGGHYTVRLEDGHLQCDCMAYTIRKRCAHILAVGVLLQRQLHKSGARLPDKLPVPHGALFLAIL